MLRKLSYILSMLFICGAVLTGTTKVLAAEGSEASVAEETIVDVEESADGIEADVKETETENTEEDTEDAANETDAVAIEEVAGEFEEEPQVVVFEADVEEETGRAYTAKDVKLLACLIYAEAGNQPYKGKVAVANVVLNRVDSNLFPNSIKEVIYQKTYSRYYGRSIYQFSVSSPSVGTLAKALRLYGKRTNAAEIKQEKECIKAAKAALEGKYGTEDVNYLFFRRYSSSLAKQKPNGKKIGAHYFYR